MVPTSEQYRRINIPILTITGQYDADQPGALEFYKQHMRYGSSFARKQHYLIIGPWDHPGTRTPKREVGGLTFGEASLVDLNKLHRDWYDWTLKSGPKPAFLKKRVAYYVTGAEEWKYTNDFEDFSGEKQILYLSSTHARSPSAFNAGIMHEKPENSPPDEFVNDPLDTRMAEVEKDEVKNFITDQRYSVNIFGDGGNIRKKRTHDAGTVIRERCPSIDFAIALNNWFVVSGDGSASCRVLPIARLSKANAAIESTTKSTGTRFRLTL